MVAHDVAAQGTVYTTSRRFGFRPTFARAFYRAQPLQRWPTNMMWGTRRAYTEGAQYAQT